MAAPLASWLDLIAGDSTRDLSFTARGPDGHMVTELRGAMNVENASIVAAEGTIVRPKRSGSTIADVEIGDAEVQIPIMVYRPDAVGRHAVYPGNGAARAKPSQRL